MINKISQKGAVKTAAKKRKTAEKAAPKKAAVKKIDKSAAVRGTVARAPKDETVKKAASKIRVVKPLPAGAEVIEAQDMAAAVRVKGGSMIDAVGRRKSSIARVCLIKNGKGAVTVNNRKMQDFFGTFDLRETVMAPLKTVGQDTAVDISAKVSGGGIRGQADAIRHGIARCLVELNPTFRTALKKQGFLTRDPRERERKKFGRKSARRSPQWSKR